MATFRRCGRGNIRGNEDIKVISPATVGLEMQKKYGHKEKGLQQDKHQNE